MANLSRGKSGPAGQNSYENGYATGGYANPPGAQTTDIDKFNFASNSNATDVAKITINRETGSGQNWTTKEEIKNFGMIILNTYFLLIIELKNLIILTKDEN